ncbi:MarR family winged helix-turn-helix transcriptional regulator [Sciscionella marina]|uniref:MarR family winged helix-turn-helix transcriptional regulator n=1 Tax=Sciscionella marina TaxID=508770 RepID=UPI00035C646A|nr:MarR family winged helix-turn-helix transcriptional regulator [Sciscionella marina]
MAQTGTLKPDEWELWQLWTHAYHLLVRELDRGLQRDCGISKAEFSVLMALSRAPGRELNVADLVAELDWEKSRVSHQLTRMENRGFVQRIQHGATGRRIRVGLTGTGQRTTQNAVRAHGANIRRCFFDSLTTEQAATLRAWSEQVVEGIEPRQ